MTATKIELDKEDWKVSLFFWSLEVCDDFTDHTTSWMYGNGTNLCHFMRVILFYMPLVLGLHLLLAAGAVAVAVFLPLRFFGVTPYLWTLGGIGAVALAAFGLLKGLRAVVRWADRVGGPQPVPAAPAQPTDRGQRKSEGPSFWDLVVAYSKAAKAYVCPGISFAVRGEVGHE